MENSANINNVQIPAPNVTSSNNASNKQDDDKAVVHTPKKKREYNMPKVGVVDVPRITTTPIQDWLDIKKEENPYTKYKIASKDKQKGLIASNILSLGVLSCSIISLLSLIKKH